MSATEAHSILIRRLDFLHQLFMEASADLASVQYRSVGERCNHANWLVGHHLWEKDVLLAEWPTGKALRPEGLTELYGFGSVPQQAGGCPDIEELRSTVDRLHVPTLQGLAPEALTRACVAAPEAFPTPMDAALHFLHDASYHLGQLDYLRKLLAPRDPVD